MNILAFDPGGTTGWALYSDDDAIIGGQLTNQHHYDLYLLMRENDPQYWAITSRRYRINAC